ncbi:MAG TPA: hypothetical protein P5230_01775 [Candidatus Magasanikbacteria bacterium]|nr:hypothetical protein [Candidatus Magasanikbacteria bacterium]
MPEEKNILAARRPKKRRTDYFDKEIGEAKQKEIADKIAKIYEDPDGKIPDMKEIKQRRKSPLLRFSVFLLVLTSIMAFFAWTGLFYFPKGEKFSEEKISLIIEGPSETELGGSGIYKIIVKNELDVPLKNLILNANYPDGFVFVSSTILAQNLGNTEWTLPDIGPFDVLELSIAGKTFGSLNQQGSWRIFLNYQPGNLNSQMQKITTFNTNLSLSPFILTSKAPEKAAYGTDVELSYTLENKNDYLPEKMYLTLKIPDNFSIISSSPSLDKDNRFVITPTSTSYFPKTFKIIGRFNGEIETEEQIQSLLELPVLAARQTYQIGKTENKIALSRTAYLMTLAINGSINDLSAKPGDPLNITVNFKNVGKASLKNASLFLKLDSPAIKKQSIMDWPEISDPLDGDIVGKQINDNLRNGTITWNKNKLKDLTEIKPNQEINVDIKLPIKDGSKIELSDLKEYMISVATEITFTDENKTQKTISGNPIQITLNSDFSFEKRVLVGENGSGKDQRNFTWILHNTFHPLKNIELSAEAYGDITFVSSSLPAGILNYNPKDKVIVWTIAEMPESVDILALPFSLIVNKKNPSQQVLLSKVKIKAEDVVTGQPITFMGGETLLFEENDGTQEEPYGE